MLLQILGIGRLQARNKRAQGKAKLSALRSQVVAGLGLVSKCVAPLLTCTTGGTLVAVTCRYIDMHLFFFTAAQNSVSHRTAQYILTRPISTAVMLFAREADPPLAWPAGSE